jgi:hypothetical protein
VPFIRWTLRQVPSAGARLWQWTLTRARFGDARRVWLKSAFLSLTGLMPALARIGVQTVRFAAALDSGYTPATVVVDTDQCRRAAKSGVHRTIPTSIAADTAAHRTITQRDDRAFGARESECE